MKATSATQSKYCSHDQICLFTKGIMHNNGEIDVIYMPVCRPKLIMSLSLTMVHIIHKTYYKNSAHDTNSS